MPTSPWRSRLASAAALTLVAGTLSTLPTTAHAADPLPIAAIQGTGPVTPYDQQQVTTTPSVVTAVYGQGSTAEFQGFVIQTPGTGGRKDLSQASDAVFVYMGSRTFDVKIGDQVVVTGTAGEFRGLTQITGSSVTEVKGSYRPVKPVTGITWEKTSAQRENLESMLYSTKEKFLVSDAYPLLPYGELGLAAGKSSVTV
jgi:predicted extracellular nuclease